MYIDKKIQTKTNIDRVIDKETDIYIYYKKIRENKNLIFNLELLLMYKITNKEKYIYERITKLFRPRFRKPSLNLGFY